MKQRKLRFRHHGIKKYKTGRLLLRRSVQRKNDSLQKKLLAKQPRKQKQSVCRKNRQQKNAQHKLMA